MTVGTETYCVVGVGSNSDVGDWTKPDLLYGKIFVCCTTRMLGIVDDIRETVDESDHCVLPVPDMITVPQTVWRDTRCQSDGGLGEEGKLRYSRAAIVKRIEIEVKGVGNPARFLYDDNGRRCSAETTLRYANSRSEELSVVGDDVVNGRKINVVGQGRQGLESWWPADGREIDLWDELGKRGGNVCWPILFI
jgi:hypothetical protein